MGSLNSRSSAGACQSENTASFGSESLIDTSEATDGEPCGPAQRPAFAWGGVGVWVSERPCGSKRSEQGGAGR